MRMQSVLGVSLMVLAVVSSAWAQNVPYPGQNRAFVPPPATQGMPAPRGAYAPPRYEVQPQTQQTYADRYSGSATGGQEWPYYPYPPYHNPYYNRSLNTREALSGTIDWFFALPSNLMDRLSGFLDGRVFPQMPASQGARPAPQASVPSQTSPAPAPVLPRAGEFNAVPR